jgi:hypothetical protein
MVRFSGILIGTHGYFSIEKVDFKGVVSLASRWHDPEQGLMWSINRKFLILIQMTRGALLCEG